jgi:hypothetical protein
MAGLVTSLRSLDSANFRTSKRADAVNEVLKSKLGLQHRYEPARLAIAHSLAMPEPVPPVPEGDADESGKTIYGRNLFGDDDLPVWIAMIVEAGDFRDPSVEDVQEQVRRHWHRGIMSLHELWEKCGGVYERFILQLADFAKLPAAGDL